MLKVGLTGGIGCGKSTICQQFHELGIEIIDTDQLARDAVRPGASAFNYIVERFGVEILHRDGTLNRDRLRHIVFSDQVKLRELEQIIHPAIRRLLHKRLAQCRGSYVIIAIPLLLEKSWQSEVDRILVVDCSESQQVERAMKRDDASEQAIRAIMSEQVSRQARLEAADDIIHNEGTLGSLLPQVSRLHIYYTSLSSKQQNDTPTPR